MFKENKKKNDLHIILIGFSFIVVVSILFFLKFHFVDQKKEVATLNEKSELEKKELASFSSITATELVKKINAQEELLILDSRDVNSFNLEHILDSKNFSLAGLKDNVSKFDKSGEYFFVDDFGLTPNEIEAMKLFRDNGIENVAYLEGGLTIWKNEFQPTISIGDPFSLSDRAKTSFITSEDLAQEISAKNPLYLIDTRSATQYKNGHLPGAINIFVDDLESKRREIPSGEKIVLYDDNGVSAFQGAVRLFDAGILNVYALSDGLNDWKKKGLGNIITD